MKFQRFYSGMLLAIILPITASAQNQTNSTTSEGSGSSPGILGPYTSSENRIPDSANKISSFITTDATGGYQSIVVDIDFDVITRPVPVPTTVDPTASTDPTGSTESTEPNDPTGATDGTLCVVKDEVKHCIGGYHAFIEIPAHDRFPYRTIQINWNPHGHFPGPFRVNHMDYHFHTQTLSDLKTIEIGKCGAEFVTCDTEEQKPLSRLLDSRHVPQGYSNADLNTSVAMMGSHLIDFPSAPETVEEFTQVFIHGAYDGKLSFQEPMMENYPFRSP